MQYPQIYIGQTPETAARRRAVRALAMDLRTRLRPQREGAPTLVLLHLPVPGAGVVDVLVARPNALIVGAVRSFDGPVTAETSGWFDRRGAAVRDEEGRTPLGHVGAQRDALRASLAGRLAPGTPEARLVDRAIAAVICAPALHADSRVALDVDDHRALRKVLGLDELPGLAAMVSAGAHLSEGGLQALVGVLGGQLWFDGARLLFELAPPRLRLRMLGEGAAPRPVLPLLEGENVVGRRRTARAHEHRLTVTGDDLISSDHALIICAEDGRVTLRDTSKNGTWITPPGGAEQFLRGEERPIQPGAQLRMGDTRMLLETVAGA